MSSSVEEIARHVHESSAIAAQAVTQAKQTTIEAARAGEAGKGFAVVAHEVKALATQTAKATGEIATQIAAMQAATKDSVGAIKGIGDTVCVLQLAMQAHAFCDVRLCVRSVPLRSQQFR